MIHLTVRTDSDELLVGRPMVSICAWSKDEGDTIATGDGFLPGLVSVNCEIVFFIS